ncbi:unnamed protein product [Phytophthora lilii]|uniref:Unnamed protein product n=1 Tax=Phytophthora lilii TaxID=2077276 RepID=A0A9W6WQH3_9STRA|nr:unnamed protein product [Phytophthora lilii]
MHSIEAAGFARDPSDWFIAKHDVYGARFREKWAEESKDDENADLLNLSALDDALDDINLYTSPDEPAIKVMGDVSCNEDVADDDAVETEINLYSKRVLHPKHRNVVFATCGRLRQLALFSITAMGLWPLALQVILVPESVFGDGHGDRYEQLSYFAFENDHYQVLEPRTVDCNDLRSILFGEATPTPTTDLVCALSQTTLENVLSLVVNQTTGDSITRWLNTDRKYVLHQKHGPTGL